MKAIALIRIRTAKGFVKPGDEFECEDAGLIKCGAARSADDTTFDDDNDTDVDLTAEERIEKIASVLKDWSESDPEKEDKAKWTKAGNPRNKAIDEAVGFDVSNDEIKAAIDLTPGDE